MLWELVTGIKDEYAVLVPGHDGCIAHKYFYADGNAMKWPKIPIVEPFVDPKRKKQKPRGDIEYFTWGAIVLNQRAYDILSGALLPFWQFLKMVCKGETLYFYNVTKLHSVVDLEKSVKIEGAVTKPHFLESSSPIGICIFKDVSTAATAIYVNDETKILLEKILIENKLLGLYFIPAGSF